MIGSALATFRWVKPVVAAKRAVFALDEAGGWIPERVPRRYQVAHARVPTLTSSSAAAWIYKPVVKCRARRPTSSSALMQPTCDDPD